MNQPLCMSTPSTPDKDPNKPDGEPAERDRDWNEDVPATPPTEPEPVPVQEPPDSPGKQRGPYIAG